MSAHLLKQQSSSSADERSSEGGYLQVPQAAHAQRSHSFDSAAASVGSDDSGAFLEVPRRLKARRSSSTKTPPPCIHCYYVEQYEKQMSAEQRYFIDHRELTTLSYSNTSSEASDDEDITEALEDDEEDDGAEGPADADAEPDAERDRDGDRDPDADGDGDGDACAEADASAGTELDDDAAAEMDIRMSNLSMGSSIEESRARLPRQMRRHTIGSSVTTSEDEGLEGSDHGSPHFGNTLLPPQPTTPCGITFTLSPTNGDYPPFPTYAFPIDPSSPPITPITPTPASAAVVRSSPLLELPPSAASHLQLSATAAAAAAALSLPAAGSSGGTTTINASPICISGDVDETGAAMGVPPGRARRRSISRQEAIFVEPTGNSLENVSHEEVDNTKSSVDTADSLDEASTMATCGSPTAANAAAAANAATAAHHAGFVVRDIYLTVPDLKRDRAASVDSCFTKLSSGGKTEELQPTGDGCFLTVPNINATRSRSVDIVLPTDEQARYKALAMTGSGGGASGAAAGLYADG